MLSRSHIEHLLGVEHEKAEVFPALSFPRKPLVIDESLHPFLENMSDFLHQGEWQVLRPEMRLLSTVGVLTCLAVFAWTNKGKTDSNQTDKTITFGAHIDAEYYLGGKRFTDNGDPYYFLRRLMSSAFKQTDPADISCYVVGSHSRGSPGATSQTMDDELVQSLRSAGYQVDISMYKIFPGATIQEWNADPVTTNFSLYGSDQCFFYVGIDSCTGRLLAHTKFVNKENPCPMWPHRLVDPERHRSHQLNPNKLLNKSSGSFCT